MQTHHPRTVIGYVRVSTDDQRVNGVSLDAQRTRLRAYCDAHDLTLLRIEDDAGISGRTMKKRPALQRALSALKAHEADGLAAVRLDRLSRTTRDVLDLVARSDRQGWTLHSIDERLDTGTPQGRFVVTILGAMAQLEREQAAARTKTALAELKRQGKRVSGRPPYGYRFEDGRVVEAPEEQPIVAELLRLSSLGLGAKAIATRMNKAGLTNPRTNGLWRHGTVRDVLARICSSTN